MTALIIIGAIIVGTICYIVDEGSFFSKLALAALVAMIAFALLGWICDGELMFILARISAAFIVVTIALRWIISIFT